MTDDKRSITEVEYERMLDRMVQRRLETDREYLNAENAEQQAVREEQIETECERELRAHYEVE